MQAPVRRPAETFWDVHAMAVRRCGGLALLALAVPLFVVAARLAPLSVGSTEPQLIGAQVSGASVVAYVPWSIGAALVARRGLVVTALLLLPVAALLVGIAPTLQALCARPGGSCG